jgi:nitrite reductase/ring-hydroxylating ferredoxin subunit
MGTFVKVAKVADIPPETARCVEVEGRRIGLFNLGGVIHAVDDTCPHADASLSEGEIVGTEVSCPLHFATFDLETGACTGPPADDDLRTYTVRVTDDGDVEVAVEPAG